MIAGKDVWITDYHYEKEMKLDERYRTPSVDMKVTRNKIELNSSLDSTSSSSSSALPEKVEIGGTLKWGIHIRSPKNPNSNSSRSEFIHLMLVSPLQTLKL
jgi:hypothetical protein